MQAAEVGLNLPLLPASLQHLAHLGKMPVDGNDVRVVVFGSGEDESVEIRNCEAVGAKEAGAVRGQLPDRIGDRQ